MRAESRGYMDGLGWIDVKLIAISISPSAEFSQRWPLQQPTSPTSARRASTSRPRPRPPTPRPPHQQHNLFGAGGHSSGSGFHAGDFNDELASLIGGSNSNERSTQSPDNSGEYRPPPHTHNIFDISAPAHHHHAHHGSASSTGSSFPSHFSLNNNTAGVGVARAHRRPTTAPTDRAGAARHERHGREGPGV
ncbi:hypothetical protein B0H14DRAFT_196255 [Mycena olivaceomarginata]|nr:hypothetical protein B0H14DRAFT_196255 [Mycena olivaceomarginata]